MINKALDILSRSNIVAYDIETTGLNIRKDKITDIGISNELLESISIPIRVWNGSELIETEYFSKVSVVLNALLNKKLIGHNFLFDAEVTKNDLGADLWDSLYLDTILLTHTCNEVGPFGLKEISKKLFGIEQLNEKVEVLNSIKENGGSSKEFYKADPTIRGKYNAKDCELTMRLFHHYMPILKQEGLEEFFFKTEVMPLYKTVTRVMASKGIPVDVELLQKSQTRIARLMGVLERSIQESIKEYTEGDFRAWYKNKEYPPARTGTFAQTYAEVYNVALPRTKSNKISITKKGLDALPDSHAKRVLMQEEYMDAQEIAAVQDELISRNEGYIFNIQSKAHFKKYFFEYLKEKPTSLTPTGQPQFEEDFIETMQHKYPFLATLHTYNKLMKIKGTYIDRFLEGQEDGIFYPQWKQHGTISGRFSGDMQQLSRKIESGDPVVVEFTNLIRKFFISGEGYDFIDADYESLEPHVFAHVSGDEGLKKIFREGLDFYSEIAISTEKLNNVSSDKAADNYLGKVNKEARQKAKAYSLGIPYGMGAFALKHHINTDQNTAQSLINKYFEAFPDLKLWYDRSSEKCRNEHRIQQEAGRVRHFPEIIPIVEKYGDWILNSLELYNDYSCSEEYDYMKWCRYTLKNALNNSRNFQIQSLGASIVNIAMIAIQKYINDNKLDAYICATIHDQIIVRANKNISKELKSVVQSLMENSYKLSVDLKAPPQISENMADGH